jgi:fructose-1,6-bisphosphatase/sedoheptulose 1,7-bisphosphatase-like protein
MDNKMPTLEDQINYINKIREENKDKILSNLNKKTREEREIINEMKKIGLKIDDVADDDIKDVVQNKPDDNAEGDFDVMQDDEEDKIEEDLDNSNYGFLYGRYNSRDYYDN